MKKIIILLILIDLLYGSSYKESIKCENTEYIALIKNKNNQEVPLSTGRTFKKYFELLKKENQRLKKENQRLKEIVPKNYPNDKYSITLRKRLQYLRAKLKEIETITKEARNINNF